MTDSSLPHSRRSSLPPPTKAGRALGKRPRMSRFLRVLVLVTTGVHLPFAVAAAYAAERAKLPHPWAISLTLTVLGIFFFLGRARAGMYDTRKSELMVKLVDIPYFIHWCACVFTIVPAIVYSILAPLGDLAIGAKVALAPGFYAGTYALGLVVCGYGILVRRRVFQVRHIEVPIPGLPAAFDGYRIAHLSDLHIGTTTPQAWGEHWVRAANEQSPDLTVVTGDLVTSGTEFYADIAAVLGGIVAKDGAFVSMGNHDYFGDGEPLIAKIRASGPRVLRNEGVMLERGGAKLFLTAIDDTWTKRDDLNAALAGREPGVPTILLSHDPDKFVSAAQRDVELTLSGHTHGGQIAMPFMTLRISLSHLAHRFHQGVYRRGRSTLYVHPGLGTTGPPMRLGVAPTIAILKLVAEK